MEEIITQLGQLSDWYSEYGCKSTDIDLLLEKQGAIVGYSYTLAEQVAIDAGLYIAAKVMRKMDEAKEYIDIKSQKQGSIADTERLALLHTRKQLLGETRAEIDYTTGKIKLAQINKVLDAMAQRISFLKKEKEIAYNSN